jgi:hypothetical protein
MDGMVRYNIWVVPVLIVFTVVVLPEYVSKKIKKTITICAPVSMAICFTMIQINAPYNCIQFSPLPKKILDTVPALYNPYSYTFIARSYHDTYGGHFGWDFSEPYWYSDDDGNIRKVLITKDSAAALAVLIEDGSIAGSAGDLAYLRQKARWAHYNPLDHGTAYINIPKGMSLRVLNNEDNRN